MFTAFFNMFTAFFKTKPCATPRHMNHRCLSGFYTRPTVDANQTPKSPKSPKPHTHSLPCCGAALHGRYLMVLASAVTQHNQGLPLSNHGNDGVHPALNNAPPQWLRMRHQSHQSLILLGTTQAQDSYHLVRRMRG